MHQTKHEVLTVRVEPALEQQLHELAKEKATPRSELIRKALQEYMKKETELEDVKRFIAKKFAEGRLSFEDMVNYLGYKEAQKIAFYLETAKRSFELGLE